MAMGPGGSRRPGAIFRRGNRDEDIAIHHEIAQTIMPAATVSWVPGSTRTKDPVRRLRR